MKGLSHASKNALSTFGKHSGSAQYTRYMQMQLSMYSQIMKIKELNFMFFVCLVFLYTKR